MIVLTWVVQVLVFFVVVKAAQILFWNVRRVIYVHPWLVELIVAVLAVILLWMADGWAVLIGFAILLGLVRGDQDEGTKQRRELL